MADLFDYLEWRGDISVSQVPMCEADYLIIGCFSYFPFDGIVPESVYAAPISMEYALLKVIELSGPNGDGRQYHLKEDPSLAVKLMDSPRFQKLDITGFVNVIDMEKEEQFAAFTLLLPDGNPIVVFRGTDRNVIGWKEDFNMAFADGVPAQVDAVNYLQAVASKYSGPIRICGHSKGGNLSIYAATYCESEVQDRIIEIWNFDGPGFYEKQSEKPEYQNIKKRIHTFVPQLSVVGMLFEHVEDYKIIRSEGKLFFQHSLYTWRLRRGELLVEPELEKLGRRFNRVVKQWLSELDAGEREKIVEGLYEITTNAGVNRVEDFLTLKAKYNLVRAFGKLESGKKKTLLDSVRGFHEAIKIVFKNARAQKKLEKIRRIEQLSENAEANEQLLLKELEELQNDDAESIIISELEEIEEEKNGED